MTEAGNTLSHGEMLSILARAEPERLKSLAQALIPLLGDIEVLKNRTGLVMLPMNDSVTGIDFHLGEVLVSEAQIFLPDSQTTGYGMTTSHDLQQAMAMALTEGAYSAGIAKEKIEAFISESKKQQDLADTEMLQRIEATRVEMETY